jgi:hypothetical protein
MGICYSLPSCRGRHAIATPLDSRFPSLSTAPNRFRSIGSYASCGRAAYAPVGRSLTGKVLKRGL